MITNSSVVDVRVDVPSATIILNRPQSKNALNLDTIKKLSLAFSDIHQEKNVAAVILTGSSDSFCSGTDLKEMSALLEDENSREKWHDETMAMNDLVESMLRFPKPIIAAVNGPAVGVGLALVLASDLVVASPNAKFGSPETKRGLVAGLVAPLLAFRLGASTAMKLTLTGRHLDADEALSIGLSHETVKDDLLWARANEMAKELSGNSPLAMKMTKTLINETIGEHFLTSLNLGTANSAAARTTESAKEGVDAFVEKRPPSWP